jgi:hypothetical protein
LLRDPSPANRPVVLAAARGGMQERAIAIVANLLGKLPSRD